MNPALLNSGSPEWVRPAVVLLAVGLAALLWCYWRARWRTGWSVFAAALKTTALAALALCLIDPLLTGARAKPGANLFAVVADDSQSLQIADHGVDLSRGEALKQRQLAADGWQQRLADDFDVRRFAFSHQLRDVEDFAALQFDGPATNLAAALNSLARRFQGLPLAGVLLLTDGNTTDRLSDAVDWHSLPPVYPVALGSADRLRDVGVEAVSVSQTNFDAAPVTVRAHVRATGERRQPLVARLVEDGGRVLESKSLDVDPGRTAVVRFQLRPKAGGVNFYRVEAAAEGVELPPPAANDQAAGPPAPAGEATLANNRRLVAVDRTGGPYRVLYVSGRPNWEFKFLRRALADDDQLELVGLVRIARRQPRFAFRPRGEDTNQLFEGFDHPDDDAAESYDEPVLVRLGTEDEHELAGGFPRTAEELNRYHALVLDDVAAEFFTHDQLSLVESFVARRGGGFLMLGGPESFDEGAYARTPVGDLLPIYLDRPAAFPATPLDGAWRLALTAEGWLEPWVRLRKTEAEDRQRLAAMPQFSAVHHAGRLKPGAAVLAKINDGRDQAFPALAAQRYGRGRSAALLIGDLWRWAMRDQNHLDSDLEKAWRQTVRWLVADVPQRVEVQVRPAADAPSGAVSIAVTVRDRDYAPLDNAEVSVRIRTPDGRRLDLAAEPGAEPGGYALTHASRQPGAYRATVVARGPGGALIGERDAGWASEPQAEEFTRLAPDRQLLEQIAARTGGEIVDPAKLDSFVAGLPARKAPITEPWSRPLWHHPLYFAAMIGSLVAEWGLRRWKGLP